MIGREVQSGQCVSQAYVDASFRRPSAEFRPLSTTILCQKRPPKDHQISLHLDRFRASKRGLGLSSEQAIVLVITWLL